MLFILFLIQILIQSVFAQVPNGTVARTMVGVNVCRQSQSHLPCLPPGHEATSQFQNPSIALKVGTEFTILKTEGDQIYFETKVDGVPVQAYANKDLILRSANSGYIIVETLSEIQKRVTGKKTLLQEYCPTCLTMSQVLEAFKCPDTSTENPVWGYAEIRSYIAGCTLSPLKLIRRRNKDDISTNCLPNIYVDYSDKEEWEACPPPPLCNDLQISEELSKAKMQLQEDQSACNPKLVTVFKRTQASKKPATINEMCVPPLHTPNKIVVHHTAATPYMDGPDIQYSHLKSGWSDMGYHFLIAKTKTGGWKVFEGRPLTHQGAHVGAGLNESSIGISIAGNYLPGSDETLNPAAADLVPPPEATAQLMALIDDLKKKYPEIKDIEAHSHAKLEGSGCHTECPGPGVEQIVSSLKARFVIEKVVSNNTNKSKSKSKSGRRRRLKVTWPKGKDE